MVVPAMMMPMVMPDAVPAAVVLVMPVVAAPMTIVIANLSDRRVTGIMGSGPGRARHKQNR
jgi:hypothetical protein